MPQRWYQPTESVWRSFEGLSREAGRPAETPKVRELLIVCVRRRKETTPLEKSFCVVFLL